MTHSKLFCSIIILGLSANLVATQRFGGAPSVTNYETFVGIISFVAALIGLAGSFISAIGGVIALAVDALTALFLFAGGIVRSPTRSVFPSFCCCHAWLTKSCVNSRHSPPSSPSAVAVANQTRAAPSSPTTLSSTVELIETTTWPPTSTVCTDVGRRRQIPHSSGLHGPLSAQVLSSASWLGDAVA